MITEFPDWIQERTFSNLPKGCRFWWVRGKIISARQMLRQNLVIGFFAPSAGTQLSTTDTHLQVVDLDDRKGAYDLRLDGIVATFAPGDTVSLFGFLYDDGRRSHPRMIGNHNSNLWYTAFPDVWQGVNMISWDDHQNWLSFKKTLGPFDIKTGYVPLRHVFAQLFDAANWIVLNHPDTAKGFVAKPRY